MHCTIVLCDVGIIWGFQCRQSNLLARTTVCVCSNNHCRISAGNQTPLQMWRSGMLLSVHWQQYPAVQEIFATLECGTNTSPSDTESPSPTSTPRVLAKINPLAHSDVWGVCRGNFTIVNYFLFLNTLAHTVHNNLMKHKLLCTTLMNNMS